uniref:Putative TMD protein n=1 Tax=Aedes anphevirus TaxID=2230910 RepID=A0A2Z4HFV2_9MONO|nr:putative TMD protein [Aedes anphevirus]
MQPGKYINIYLYILKIIHIVQLHYHHREASFLYLYLANLLNV